MITEQQYKEAARVIGEYFRQIYAPEEEPRASRSTYQYAELLGIHDSRHPYDYLKEGEVYPIKKWYPPLRTPRPPHRIWRNEMFSIMAGGKTRKYYTNTGLLTWKFF